MEGELKEMAVKRILAVFAAAQVLAKNLEFVGLTASLRGRTTLPPRLTEQSASRI